MHESVISQKAAEIILKRAKDIKAKRVISVDIEIGELTFFSAEQVEFWLKTILNGTIASDIKVNIKSARSKIKCEKCGHSGPIKLKNDPLHHMVFPVLSCPKCSSSSIKITKGKECLIKKIKLELAES